MSQFRIVPVSTILIDGETRKKKNEADQLSDSQKKFLASLVDANLVEKAMSDISKIVSGVLAAWASDSGATIEVQINLKKPID